MPRRLEGSNPSEGTPWLPKDTLIKVSDNSSKVYIQEWIKSARSTESSRVAIELDWYRNNVKPVSRAAA